MHDASPSEVIRSRGVGTVAAATALALVTWLGPALPFGTLLFASATCAQTGTIAAAGWLVFMLATAAFHVTRARRAFTYRALARCDELMRHGVLLALVYVSGSASSPLWVIALARAFSSNARSAADVRIAMALVAGSHSVLAVAFLFTGRAFDAALVGLAALAWCFVYCMAAQTSLRNRRLRLHAERLIAERDRTAREVHDGAASHLMALALRLQRIAQEKSTTGNSQLVERADRIVENLQHLVESDATNQAGSGSSEK